MDEMKECKVIAIRPLQQEDAIFLCSIFRDNPEYYAIFFDSGDTEAEWERRVNRFLGQNEVHHFIIEACAAPVGWISFFDTESQDRELCILVIHKDQSERGYGSSALSWLIGKSKADHMRCLLLNVNQSNARAIHFYQKFGFEIIGEEIVPECNDAVNLAQYIMRLNLS